MRRSIILWTLLIGIWSFFSGYYWALVGALEQAAIVAVYFCLIYGLQRLLDAYLDTEEVETLKSYIKSLQEANNELTVSYNRVHTMNQKLLTKRSKK